MRTPTTVITGPLGSGKTTLLRHLLEHADGRWAVVMNEFGDIDIDARVIEGSNVRIAELAGGCVCCSLAGEFAAAIDEILDTVAPERVIVETTGLAEPEAMIVDIEQALPRVRLDGVVTVIDADGLHRYPALGHALRLQVAAADLLLLNKLDLIERKALASLEAKLRALNEAAPILRCERGQVDPALLFGKRGAGPALSARAPVHAHTHEFDAFSWSSEDPLDRTSFETFAAGLGLPLVRAKGFVRFRGKSYLFNWVAGRWELEPFEHPVTELVFIGKSLPAERDRIERQLQRCRCGSSG